MKLLKSYTCTGEGGLIVTALNLTHRSLILKSSFLKLLVHLNYVVFP